MALHGTLFSHIKMLIIVGEDGCFEDMVRATMPSASSYPPFHLYSLERICTGVAVFSKNRAAYDHFNRLDNDGRVDHGFLIGMNPGLTFSFLERDKWLAKPKTSQSESRHYEKCERPQEICTPR